MQTRQTGRAINAAQSDIGEAQKEGEHIRIEKVSEKIDLQVLRIKAENESTSILTDLRKYVVEMENLRNRRKARAGYGKHNKGIQGDHGKTRAATHIRSGEEDPWLTNGHPWT